MLSERAYGVYKSRHKALLPTRHLTRLHNRIDENNLYICQTKC